ncbi:MAG: NTP transferase domain-containing protein [Candidatus Lokiarchaeota archaeon]|nr:NTP transferase domain-containing protein [Candidatus Lokiarchaeota archaeon]
MKSLKEKLQVVILCAGEGARFREDNSNIPKSLTPIQSMDNKPLLDIIITDLLNQGLKNINLILGSLGNVIESHIFKLKSRDPILNNCITILNAHPDYKKGPLFTLLTILDYPEIFKKDSPFLVFPGDTVFDQNLLYEILKLLITGIDIFQGKPIIFYKRVRASDIKKTSISRVKTIKKRNTEILARIEEIDLLNNNEAVIKQILPVLFLNCEFLEFIYQIVKSSHSNKISDILNEVCNTNLQEVIACEIISKGSFYDIDSVHDLDHLNKKRNGQ